MEKYLSFGSGSDELNFSIVFLVQFLIKRNIRGIGEEFDLTLRDMTDSYISHYRLTTEIEEPIYNYEMTLPKYGDNNYITKRTDEYFNKLIDTEPLQMTIIWIYNSLRAGKQLNTKNVGFIHDSYSTNTDTTAQALLGRVCGYNKKDHNGFKPPSIIN